MILLKIQNISKKYGKKNAINRISFELNKGEILGVLGESGSGKTTLLHLIAAIAEPDAGTLFFEGKQIVPPSAKLIAGHPEIKLVKQDYGLFPNITIRENIAYELRFYKENYRNKRVDKLLKISGLTSVQGLLPRQVSGGEQQRAVIAKAIAEQPKLLLLDEPFSNLDLRNKRKFKEFILQVIREEGVSCIFVTHEISDAFGMADRLFIMKNGRFLQGGTPKQIYQNPVNQYVAETMGDCNWLNLENVPFLKLLDLNQNKKILVRPEDIEIDLNGFEAIVKEAKFMGRYNEIICDFEGIDLKFYHKKDFEIGSKLHLLIKNFRIINKT